MEELEGFKTVVCPILDAADAARLTPCEGERKRRVGAAVCSGPGAAA
jgi:hypothetical protein